MGRGVDVRAPGAYGLAMIKLGDLELIEGRPVVAVSFTDVDSKEDLAHAKAAGVQIAELRIDLFARFSVDYVLAQIGRLSGLPTVATVRIAAEGGGWTASEGERIALYQAVLPLVDAIDVELQADRTLAVLAPLAKSQGKLLIVSHHDFDKTPSYETLADVARRAQDAGADIVKIAASIVSDADIDTLGRLLSEPAAPNLVVIGMGEHGAPTRLLFPGRGSLFTFAAKGDRSTAPGQLDYLTTLKFLRSLYPAT